jgi:hypothetical protein
MPSPNTRLYIARSLRALNRNADAYGEYLHAAIEADERSSSEPRYARAAESARQEAQALLARIALLTVAVVDAPPDTTVQVDGEALERGRWNTEVPHEPGNATVDASAPGRTPFHTTQALQPGMQSRIEIRLAPTSTGETAQIGQAPTERAPAPVIAQPTPTIAPPTAPPNVVRPERGGGLRAAGGVILGVGIVGLIAGTIGGGLAQANYTSLTNCTSGSVMPPTDCPTTGDALQSRVNAGGTEEAVANVGWIAGGAVAALGLALLIGGVVQGSSDAAPAAQARIVPIVDPAHGMLGAGGVF